MALSGNLRDFNLPDVFQLVSFSRKTGALHIIRDDGVEGSIYFKDGEVFFATSNWNRDPLGLRLVKARQIGRKQLDHALQLQKEAGEDAQRLGAILVKEGYVSAKTLEAFVQEQIQDTIFDLMRWDEGQFDFRPVDLPAEEDIGLTVSIENIIMEGARRLDEWNRIKKKIPSLDIVFKMATAPGEGTFEISLKPSEWRLITLIDGTRDVERLAVDLGLNDFDVSRILYGMYSAGLLEVVSGEELEELRMEQAKKKAKAASEAAAAAIREEQQPEAPVIQLVPEPEKAEAEAAAPAGEAPAKAPSEEPAAETPAEEAVEEPAAQESPATEAPLAEETAEVEAPAPEPQPAAEAPAGAPTEEPVLEEPVAEAPAEEAAEEPVAAQAVAPEPQPAAEVPVAAEPAEEAIEEPAAEVPAQAPIEEPVAEAPSEEVPTEASPEAPVAETPPPPEEVPAEAEATVDEEATERALSDLLAEVDESASGAGEGFADELTALTGVQMGGPTGKRVPKPAPEPEPQAEGGFHRDHSVSKETVLEIIEGLKEI